MLANILSALSLLKEIFDMIKAGFSLYKKAKKEGWTQDGKEITKKILEAKTPEERRKLAKEINQQIQSI